jgi:hypothetical protein
MKVFDAGLEAYGIIAIGQFATGVFAFGQVATGVIAIGQLARGVVTVGQVSIGIVSVGQLAIGLGAGMVGLGSVTGGLLAIPVLGYLPLGKALQGRFEFSAIHRGAGRALYLLAMAALVIWVALWPLAEALGSGSVADAPRR